MTKSYQPYHIDILFLNFSSIHFHIHLQSTEFIWYLYPKWNNQLYGYKPNSNTSVIPKNIVGEVVEQRDEGIHSIFFDTGSNKIVLGTLADTLGNITTFPAFTISFLYKVNTLPLPNAVSVRLFVSSPRKEERKNSNPVEIRLIQIGSTISFYAAVGHHDKNMKVARVDGIAKVTQWFHISIMYTGLHQNETLVYLNGTRMASDNYNSPISAEPSNPTPYEYSLGFDKSQTKFSMSWFQVFRGVLNEKEAMELSEATFSQGIFLTS